jgi:hypothetical protein
MNVYFSGLPKIKERILPDVTVAGKHTLAHHHVTQVLQQDILVPTYTTRTSYERIMYNTRRRDERGKSNMCSHIREYFNYTGGSGPFLSTTTSPNWDYQYQNHHRAICDARSSIVAAAETALGGKFLGAYLGSDGQVLINSAFDKLRPDLTTLSVPNFLLELDDITKLYKAWKGRVKILRDLSTRYRAIRANLEKGSLFTPSKLSDLRSAAEAHLEFKFAWKPTFGDLSDLVLALTGLRDKIRAFNDSIGKIVQSSASLENSSSTVSGTHTSGGFAGTVSYKATVTRNCRGFIAYAPQPPAVLNDADLLLRGIIDSLGFELNPRIVWDALPFTFVIDWFFDVGGWLSILRLMLWNSR